MKGNEQKNERKEEEKGDCRKNKHDPFKRRKEKKREGEKKRRRKKTTVEGWGRKGWKVEGGRREG